MAEAWGKKAPAPKLSCRWVTIPHPTLTRDGPATPFLPPTRPILCRDFQRAAWCMHAAHSPTRISEMLASGTLGEGCASFFLSKILGSCVLLGSLAFKVPQILKIHTNKSAAGVSISQFWMELCVSAMSLSFNYHIEAPFTTYGESFFILAQNVIIVFQIRFFSKMPWAKFGAIWILYLALLTFLFSPFAKNLQVFACESHASALACMRMGPTNA